MSALAPQQLAALNRLIAAIASTNAFYRRKLTAADGLAGFDSLDRFRNRMPFTTKEELARDQLEHPPYGTTLTYPSASYTRFHQTSGTGGKPLIWLDTPASWQWVLGNWKEVWQKAGAVAGDTAFFAFSFGPFLGFWAAFDSAVQLGIRAIPAGGLSSLERLRFLLARRPRHLCCTPTYALRLAEVARAESLDLREAGVERILVAGEPGGSVPAIRARIEQAWPGARVVDHHGMTEIGPVSYGVPEQSELLRLMHHAYFCEVLKPGSNEPVAPGENGELVLTTLGRDACPLLRYRTGDLVKPVTPLGASPAEFALEGGVLGRVDDMVIVRGVNLYPSALEAAIRAVSGVREYQVEIDKRRTLPEVTVRFEAVGLGDPSEELAKHLRAAFQMRIAVEKVPGGILPVFEMKARRWKILNMIQVSRVSKVYETPAGTVSVLRDLDLSVGAAETVAIVGPSGSGKTTLLNLLGALDQPTSGTLTIDGQAIGNLDATAAAHFRNRSIGFIFQLHYLLPQCTVLENVLVPRLAGAWDEAAATTRARAESLLEQVGLQDRISSRPYQLSGGEQLRVAIARALINQPKIILADEPTGSLDPATGERIADLLLRANESARVALVVVTHNPGLAQRMRKTYRLEEGKLRG